MEVSDRILFEPQGDSGDTQQPRQGCAVAIVSPHLLEADGLAGILLDAGFSVPLLASQLEPSRLIGAKHRPDVTLLDACLCGDDLSAIRSLISQGLVTAVLIGQERDGQFIQQLLQAGARGCLSCDEEPSRFAECVKMIARGAVVLSSSAAALITATPPTAEIVESRNQLTEREKQIALMVSQGATNREIGEALYISEHTVKIYLGHVLDKFHLRNRQQLAAYVADHGIVPDSPAG